MSNIVGNPVECTGEFFSGASALDIVEAMRMHPFTAHLDPLAFMRQVLDKIGQKDFDLTGPPEKAAVVFLQRLTALNFAGYELEPVELEISPVSGSHNAESEKASQKTKNFR